MGRPCQGYGTRWGPRGAAFRARWRSSCLPCFGVTWLRAEWVACVSPGSCEHRWGQATLATVLTALWAVPCSVSWEQRWSRPDSSVRGKAPRFLALLCFVARGWPALAPPAPGCSRRTQSCREGPPVCTRECRDRAGRVWTVWPLCLGAQTVGMPGGSYPASPLRPRTPLLPMGGADDVWGTWGGGTQPGGPSWGAT